MDEHQQVAIEEPIESDDYKVKIPTNKLQDGMYVCELDRPWICVSCVLVCVYLSQYMCVCQCV